MRRAFFIMRTRKPAVVQAVLALVILVVSLTILPQTHAKINRPGLIYWRGDAVGREAALTFDDGPNEPYTSEILGILKRYNVQATFFLVGKNVETYPDAARAIVLAGHSIGNHSYSHPDLVWDTDAAVRRQILKTDAIIRRVTGQTTRLFRPPFGSEDFLTLHQARKLGYIMVEWSVSARDWKRPGAARIVSNVMRHIHPGDIVLLHDGDKGRHGGDRSQTVAALPLLITQLRQQGYKLVTIPELLKLHHAAS